MIIYMHIISLFSSKFVSDFFSFFCLFVCLFVFVFFAISWAAPVAYRGSQARGPIRAVAAGLHTTATATLDPSRIFDLHHSSRQCQILNPLSKARDRTRNLLVPSQIR